MALPVFGKEFLNLLGPRGILVHDPSHYQLRACIVYDFGEAQMIRSPVAPGHWK